MLRDVLLAAAALVGFAAAVPKPSVTPTYSPTSSSTCRPRTLCVDGLDKCGQRWGGCYDTCKPTLKPTPPPCTPTPTYSTTTPVRTTTFTPTTTRTPPVVSVSGCTSKTTDNCSTRTVCADYINSCGMMYGGCFPDCKPWPTFTPPPCPSNDGCSTRTICADYVNSCGMWYGGCFSECKPWPTFTPPPCPPTYRPSYRPSYLPSPPTTTTVPSTTTTTPPTVITSPPTVITSPPTSTDCKSRSVCVDSVNSCGKWYGGCFADCKPWPTFTPPPCP